MRQTMAVWSAARDLGISLDGAPLPAGVDPPRVGRDDGGTDADADGEYGADEGVGRGGEMRMSFVLLRFVSFLPHASYS